MTGFAEAVARYAYKLMAYKDEYEVARLYTDGNFLKKLNAQFEGDFKLSFHLAPPLTNRADPTTGEAKKSEFGPWMLRAFGLQLGRAAWRESVGQYVVISVVAVALKKNNKMK